MNLSDIFANPEQYAKFAQETEKKTPSARVKKPVDDPALQREMIGILQRNIHGLTALDLKKILGTMTYFEDGYVEEGPIGNKVKIKVAIRKRKDRFTTTKVIENLKILAAMNEIVIEKNGEKENVGTLIMYGDRNFVRLVKP